jgi:N-acetylneuraminate synthase
MSHTVIIAEAGVNHNGDMLLAERLVQAAVAAGADYVKFQMFTAGKLSSPDAPQAEYQIKNLGEESSQSAMLAKLELDLAAHRHLQNVATAQGIGFLSSPFDLDSLSMLRSLDLDYIKVPSGEIINLPMLEAIGRCSEKIILSTGMCDIQEIHQAVEVLTDLGVTKERLTLLHCNTEYPTPYEDVNLRAMDTIAEAFGCGVGYSDHTLGSTVPLAAVARGAVMIEKHLTLDRNMAGPDHAASMEPAAFKDMVEAIRDLECALGSFEKRPSPSESKNMAIARKSIHYTANLSAGHVLQKADMAMLRPGDGISPMRYREFIGKELKEDVQSGTALSETHFR